MERHRVLNKTENISESRWIEQVTMVRAAVFARFRQFLGNELTKVPEEEVVSTAAKLRSVQRTGSGVLMLNLYSRRRPRILFR